MNLFLVRTLILTSAVFFSGSVFTYYDGRLYYPNLAPYPIGCANFVVTEPTNFHAHAHFEVIYSETMQLWDVAKKVQLEVEVLILRIGCTEPDRSIILVQLSVPNTDDDIQSWVPVPLVFAEIDGWFYPLRLTREANTVWRINEVLAEGERGGFYLDNSFGFSLSPEFEGIPIAQYKEIILPSQYNNEFRLHFVDRTIWNGDLVGPSFLIPAYADQLKEDRLLWHGMLSGIWVTPEKPDQGFLLSINEKPAPGGTLSLFLIWSTFDQEGNQLWLAGNGPLKPHSEMATIDLILVTNGQFLGSRKSERLIAGSIGLIPKSCTELIAEFDLEAVGLGSGGFILTRLEGLEMSGYSCQDFETRRIYE